MAIMKQGQSKRAQALQQQAEAQGIEWLGRDGGTWTMVGRKGPVHHRTIGGMKALLDSHEHDAAYVGDHYVLSPIAPDGEPHPDSDAALEAAGIGLTTMKEPFTTGDEELFIAKKGDHVRIDARTENEIQGIVVGVNGEIVTVRATKVILRGSPRPDYIGYRYFPSQNGTERPWGLTDSLEKM